MEMKYLWLPNQKVIMEIKSNYVVPTIPDKITKTMPIK